MKAIEYENGILYNGDVLSVLREIESDSVDIVITSPPYYGLRDYGGVKTIFGGDPACDHNFTRKSYKTQSGGGTKKQTSNAGSYFFMETAYCEKCGAWEGQLGQEPTYQEFINHLIEVFDEVKRVLKPTGTLWVNFGDSYNNTKAGGGIGKTAKVGNTKNPDVQSKGIRNRQMQDVPKKSMMLVPERFAIRMVDSGWIMRNVIIWHKPNAMPESVRDRFTKDFEYIYFFTKSPKYYFKQILEPFADETLGRVNRNYKENKGDIWSAVKAKGSKAYAEKVRNGKLEGRNKRTVWDITLKSYKDAHFATFPKEIPETCISAGCPEGGTVMDIFMGSGTTAEVAERMKRKWIGIEINSEYCELINSRLCNIEKTLF